MSLLQLRSVSSRAGSHACKAGMCRFRQSCTPVVAAMGVCQGVVHGAGGALGLSQAALHMHVGAPHRFQAQMPALCSCPGQVSLQPAGVDDISLAVSSWDLQRLSLISAQCMPNCSDAVPWVSCAQPTCHRAISMMSVCVMSTGPHACQPDSASVITWCPLRVQHELSMLSSHLLVPNLLKSQQGQLQLFFTLRPTCAQCSSGSTGRC